MKLTKSKLFFIFIFFFRKIFNSEIPITPEVITPIIENKDTQTNKNDTKNLEQKIIKDKNQKNQNKRIQIITTKVFFVIITLFFLSVGVIYIIPIVFFNNDIQDLDSYEKEILDRNREEEQQKTEQQRGEDEQGDQQRGEDEQGDQQRREDEQGDQLKNNQDGNNQQRTYQERYQLKGNQDKNKKQQKEKSKEVKTTLNVEKSQTFFAGSTTNIQSKTFNLNRSQTDCFNQEKFQSSEESLPATLWILKKFDSIINLKPKKKTLFKDENYIINMIQNHNQCMINFIEKNFAVKNFSFIFIQEKENSIIKLSNNIDKKDIEKFSDQIEKNNKDELLLPLLERIIAFLDIRNQFALYNNISLQEGDLIFDLNTSKLNFEIMSGQKIVLSNIEKNINPLQKRMNNIIKIIQIINKEDSHQDKTKKNPLFIQSLKNKNLEEILYTSGSCKRTSNYKITIQEHIEKNFFINFYYKEKAKYSNNNFILQFSLECKFTNDLSGSIQLYTQDGDKDLNDFSLSVNKNATGNSKESFKNFMENLLKLNEISDEKQEKIFIIKLNELSEIKVISKDINSSSIASIISNMIENLNDRIVDKKLHDTKQN